MNEMLLTDTYEQYKERLQNLLGLDMKIVFNSDGSISHIKTHFEHYDYTTERLTDNIEIEIMMYYDGEVYITEKTWWLNEHSELVEMEIYHKELGQIGSIAYENGKITVNKIDEEAIDKIDDAIEIIALKNLQNKVYEKCEKILDDDFEISKKMFDEAQKIFKQFKEEYNSILYGGDDG